jgi:hypothetical protein
MIAPMRTAAMQQLGPPVELPAERPQPKRLPIKVALAANDGLPPVRT